MAGENTASSVTVLPTQSMSVRDALRARLRQADGATAKTANKPNAAPLAPGLSSTA